ncbi:family 43 glycosylhydrolase [Kribbella sp. NPDC056951]|uniref:family 43 glycosylhydrolase n=1 Tax=Kribbella sp. NPDC056951 TaxID=3345978 RepID=UPI003628C39A
MTINDSPGGVTRRSVLAGAAAAAAGLTLGVPAFAAVTADPAITNDVFWKDTAGNPIFSQGGGVLLEGNTYYWYGVKYNGAVTYYNNPSGKNSDTSFNAVTCYSSTDLVNWTFRGNVITAASLGASDWVGRLGVARNPNTGKYVLVTQYNGPLGSGVLFATSSTPTGSFTTHHVQTSIANVVNGMSGDQTVFIDDNGKAYLVFSNTQGRSHLYVSALRPSDYLNIEPATNVFNSSSGGREGNVMFKHGGRYYFCSSDLHGWNSSHTYYISATNILGPYSGEAVMQGSTADFSHVSQTGMMIPVNGSSGSFVISAGDRWSDFAGNGLGYNQWVPITFNGSTPVMRSLSQWTLNESTGQWAVGAGNNYAMNPSFEADRVATTNLTGWQKSVDAGADATANVSPGRTGRWAMTHWDDAAYKARLWQSIAVPNGTYTLRAWVRGGGGQNRAEIFARGYGGSDKVASIASSISAWTQITISGINVTNGTVEVGVYSDAKANNWVRADDFSLTRS